VLIIGSAEELPNQTKQSPNIETTITIGIASFDIKLSYYTNYIQFSDLFGKFVPIETKYLSLEKL
jgi:hypothetical protein